MQKFVEDIYLEYKGKLEMFGNNPSDYDDEKRDSYIYGWRTKTNPKKYFYIGKGKKDRYKHILWEIRALEDKRKIKGKKYKILQDNLGIECDFLYSNITQKEAVILESYTILEFLNKKEPLLNMITAYLSEDIEDFRHKVIYEKNEEKFLSFYK